MTEIKHPHDECRVSMHDGGCRRGYVDEDNAMRDTDYQEEDYPGLPTDYK